MSTIKNDPKVPGALLPQTPAPAGKTARTNTPADVNAAQNAAFNRLEAGQAGLLEGARMTQSSATASALSAGAETSGSAAPGTFLGQTGFSLQSLGFSASTQEASLTGSFSDLPL